MRRKRKGLPNELFANQTIVFLLLVFLFVFEWEMTMSQEVDLFRVSSSPPLRIVSSFISASSPLSPHGQLDWSTQELWFAAQQEASFKCAQATARRCFLRMQICLPDKLTRTCLPMAGAAASNTTATSQRNNLLCDKQYGGGALGANAIQRLRQAVPG